VRRPVTPSRSPSSSTFLECVLFFTSSGRARTALTCSPSQSLERLVASASDPSSSAEVFEQLMPAARIWLTLYAQDIWCTSSSTYRPSSSRTD